MGKAGKWIKNLLLGKREEKHKKIHTFYPENNTATSFDTKVKRRWSLGKPTFGSARITSKVAVNIISTSFDSGDSAKLQIQALLETHSPRCLQTALAKACEDIEVKTAAATMIQAAFRSYLARRALHALRGLVKIQALVRGHLVRKQATATMRGMHALMAIQVRARIHRIQVAGEANHLGKQPPQHREFRHFKGCVTEENKDSKDMNLAGRLEALKSRSGPLDCSHVKSRKYDSMAFYSKHLSVSKRENQYKQKTLFTAPNSPVNNRRMSDVSPATMDLKTSLHHIVPHRQSWSPSYMNNNIDMSEFNPATMDLSTSLCHIAPHHQSWSPSYMNNTESSKAKSRSRSEPRQRPKKGTKHQSKFVESPLNGPRQNLFSKSLRFDHENLDHWVINLHGSMKESKRDSLGSSTVTSDSYY